MQSKILSLITCFFWGWYCPAEIKTEIEVRPQDPEASLILLINEQEQNFNETNQTH